MFGTLALAHFLMRKRPAFAPNLRISAQRQVQEDAHVCRHWVAIDDIVVCDDGHTVRG